MTSNLLSVQGQQRRDEILTLVLEDARRIQRRRKRRRRLGSATAMVLIVATVLWTFWTPVKPTLDRPQASRSRNGSTRPTSRADLQLERHLVRTEVDDLGAYLVRTHEQIPAGILLDDTQLLLALAALGRVEGIIRVDGKTWLTSEFDARSSEATETRQTL